MTTRCLLISDEFTERCLSPELDCRSFRYDADFEQLVESHKPHLLFVESTWSGRDSTWGGVFLGPNYGRYLDLLEVCRKHSIPTAFWSKEDPPKFDTFIRAAMQADYIFTTDEGCISKYVERGKHAWCLPFAAQVVLHNPLDMALRIPRVCFAGTYWTSQYPERNKYLDMILDASLEVGLDIYDRNFGDQGNDRLFPERFKKNILGKLPYLELVKKYSEYQAFINANSVQLSNTMLSRRAFEVLACGTPVISTPSPATTNMTPAAIQIHTPDEAKEAVHLVFNEKDRQRIAIDGIRETFGKHTYAHRTRQILERIGIEDPEVDERCKMLTGILEEQESRGIMMRIASVLERYKRVG